jgi:hypothetical protein
MNPIRIYPTGIGEQQEAMSLASWMIMQMESVWSGRHEKGEMEELGGGKKSDWECVE